MALEGTDVVLKVPPASPLLFFSSEVPQGGVRLGEGRVDILVVIPATEEGGGA